MGRRWGKTVLGSALALATAAQGGRVAWGVPYFRNGRPLWKAVEQAVAPLRRAGLVRVNQNDRLATFYNGGEVGIYSMDNPDSMRGFAFHLVIIDEAARVQPDVYTDVIMPMLADYNGDTLLISSPKGRNWFWQEFQRGLADTAGRQAAFTASSAANPSQQIRAAFELARTRVSERTFRQEWLAEFVDDGGGVFRNVRAAASAKPQTEALPGHEYVIGADWGRTGDATVFKVLDLTLKHEVFSDRMVDANYPLQLARLTALYAKFGEPLVIAEYNSMGGPLVEQLQRTGMNVTAFNTTNATKANAIDALALAFERGELKILDDPLTIGELEAYESERLPSGLVRYGAPAGLHDDLVMGLALAWVGVGYQPQTTPNTLYD